MTPTITVLLVADGSPGIPGVPSLERRDVAVLQADDAIDALKQLEDGDVGGVVCGVSPEDFPVDEFVSMIREGWSALPIVLVGEPDRPTALYRALAHGGVDYVEPGADPGTVGDRIERAVARRRAGAALDDHGRIKSLLWEVARSLIDSTSRREVEETVYDGLSRADLYRFVWIGEHDESTGGLSLSVPFDGVLDPTELGTLVGSDDTALIDRAMNDGEVTTTRGRVDTRSAAATTVADAPGRPIPQRAMVSAVVPLVDGDIAYGAAVLLTDRAHAFDGAERAALQNLGEVVARAIRLTESDTGRGDRTREFAGMLAHELRNPLGIAISHLDLARESGEEEDFERIEAALGEIGDTIEAVLAVVGTQQVGERTTGQLSDDAEAAWAGLEAAEAELVVVDSTRIDADHDLLVRLLANLFRNAVTHAGEGVTIRVGTLPGGFYVEDDGPGIPADDQDRVFEWGYSTDDSLGIGLSFVRAIVAAHGWEVTVTEGRNGGARFEVTGVSGG